MSHKLSNCRTAARAASFNLSQSQVLSSLRNADKLILTRLHVAILFLSCGNVISVHKLLRWIVPVLLFNARTLIVSFQVSHGCEVACKLVKMRLNCWRAGTLSNVRNFPASAIFIYSLYRAENASPYNSVKSGVSAGSNKYQSWSFSTRFINSSEINTAVFANLVRKYGSPEFWRRSTNWSKFRCQFSM